MPYLTGTRVLVFACLIMGVSGVRGVCGQQLEAYMSADSVTIGERFTLTLTALHGFDESPSFPPVADVDSVFGDFVPLGLISAGTEIIEPGVRLDSVVYGVTTFALDSAILPPLRVGFESGATEGMTPAVMLPVISLVSQEASGIRDLAEPVEFGTPRWPYFLLGLGVVILAGLIWYFFIRKRPPEVIVQAPADPENPPHLIALARLRALETAPMATRDQVESYYVELSDTVRTYLEHRLGILALESTTPEIRQALLSHDVGHMMPSGIPTQVERILSLADLVKFANFSPEPAQGQQARLESVDVVERVETKLGQVASGEQMMSVP
ncbi:MAG: hypothetical protein OXM02_05790 [Bacteroidota bacterium]|nr:hypothetical protein [Bacteroidota bacterium]